MAKKTGSDKTVETLKHETDTRKNIPTAELQAVLKKEDAKPREVRYARNRDLDPQLMWRGKDERDWSDLVVSAPPLYIQEKVHPKVLIDDLLRQTREGKVQSAGFQADLFADFNGVPKGADKTEFYQHDQHWANRMILGDSLQAMASLAEREGLRGKVQCIYFDPPYGIKFNSNFQWSTTSRDVKDGNAGHITREPEQVKAFRDTWRDGIHSYLTYVRDRLTVMRDLLTESGSIFVQIGEENAHRVRAVMDEVFGDENFCGFVQVQKTSGAGSPSIGTTVLASVMDYLIWFAKKKTSVKYHQLYRTKVLGEEGTTQYVNHRDRTRLTDHRLTGTEAGIAESDIFAADNLTSPTAADTTTFRVETEGSTFIPKKGGWKTNRVGMDRLHKSARLKPIGNTLMYRRYLADFRVSPINNLWRDVLFTGFAETKTYVVQTAERVIQRCLLMTTDPGDLVLDPTCGSGTTATVAEQWGRRWITIDTSRVALALARARIMGARYPFYLLADSPEGQVKEAEVIRRLPSSQPTHGNIRHGFVYERVPHITLKSIANNTEIDVLYDKWQAVLEPLREKLNASLKKTWEEWEIPRDAEPRWTDGARKLHSDWWQARIGRQKELDASIDAKAESEFLFDKPYEDKRKVRVAGPFTVESLSPHRMLGVDENDVLIDTLKKPRAEDGRKGSFPEMILETLKAAGVQQAHKEDRIAFTAFSRWPGSLVCADGRYREGDAERRAAIFIGPEFGTVQRADLVEAAREAAEAGFDVLIACAFNYEAHATEFNKLGRLPVLKARMNADLHMSEDLKNTGKGNLFVIFGEPDVRVFDGATDSLAAEVVRREARVAELMDADKRLKVASDPKEKERLSGLIRERERHQRFVQVAPGVLRGQSFVEIWGVDVFKPQTGEVISHGADGIACWFLDTDYNEESFFVRHAYFLGANDPYGALKTTLKAEIDPDAWASLNSDISRPFARPKGGRIAVKVINHLGDEVMKVFKV